MHNRKPILAFSIYWFVLFFPFAANCQFHGKYSIKIILDRPTPTKPSLVKLFDSTGKAILKKYWDTLGQCRFTGINKGVYRVINRKYKIDTTFSMPMDTVLPGETQFDMFIEFNRCTFGARQARQDIKRDSVRLLLIGGLAPTEVLGQEKFEKRFHITYYDFGDTGPPESCVARYNRVIFAYLDSKYGNAWRYFVRRDVIGVKDYIKTQPVKY
jgi:hypothetical protein